MWALLLATVSAAPAGVTFSAVRIVEIGGAPSITFNPSVQGGITVTLTCGPKTFTWSHPIEPGTPVTMGLNGMPQGLWNCTGLVHLDVADGSFAETPLQLQAGVLQPMGWSVRQDDFDHHARVLRTHPSRRIQSATAEAWGELGVHLDRLHADLADPLNPVFRFNTTEEIVKITVIGVDEHGFRSQLDLSPWFYEIPHDDVVFRSGSHEIDAAETPKLESTWTLVEDVLRRYGTVVDVKLYVAGYTDTVGSSASNQGLSERRARSIASWFRQRGFRGEVFYQGFGETVLALHTADETDELANRRALYVLSAQPPPQSEPLPRADWRALR